MDWGTVGRGEGVGGEVMLEASNAGGKWEARIFQEKK